MRYRTLPAVRRQALSRSRSSRWRRVAAPEPLESRSLLSAAGLPVATLNNLFALPAAHLTPVVINGVPTGDTPAQIRQAYGFDQVSFSNGGQTIAGNGSGQTIAIVDAYGDSNISDDLHAFDAQFGLPDPNLSVVNQQGGTRLPSNNASWALETALDVEWAHAMAPNANLLLVEAETSSLGDLLTAVNYARNQPGVVAVSMSWGTNEFSGETAYDGYFSTPSGHGGVTFVAASGDSGAETIWPAASPNVLSVGGTALALGNSGGTYGGEVAWSGSGGGVSLYEPQPIFQAQSGLVSQSGTNRTTPDVSYDASPGSGVAVYDSIGYAGQSGWFQVGGTSAAAPQWAALVAVADQGRQINNGGTADSLPNAQASLYGVAANAGSYASDFHDVTSGSTGASSFGGAGVGYDLATGLGTPKVASLVASLVQAPATTVVSTVSSTTKADLPVSSSTIPTVVLELILLDLVPEPTQVFVPVVPNTTTSPPPAPVVSLVMPAESGVQLASNSLLTDDPLAVPLTPNRRAASETDKPTIPDDRSQRSGAAEERRFWEQMGEDAFGDLWSHFEIAPEASTSATDSLFAEYSLGAFAADGDVAAGALAFAADSGTKVTGLVGLVVVGMLFEKGSRAEEAAPELARRGKRSRRPL
ncbi:MAG TPA: S53 family peptidase [Pirellulales bacterium]|nr:S53 family peptidase [Pirellulales bacterium]